MATINISSIIQYYNTGNGVGSGTATVSGYTTSDGAKSAAQTAAQTAANSIGGGTPNSGGSSSTSGRKFGKVHGSVTSNIGTPRATASTSGTGFDGSCSWSATRTSTIYQLKLKFTLPSGVTTSNLNTVTLSFSATNNNTTSQTYRVCAPKSTTEQTSYEKYGSTTTIDTATYKEFSSPNNTDPKAFEIDIKDIFKKCITNNQGWITILIPSATASDGDRYMTISGTPTITYTTSYTKCGAPTSISSNKSIQKPNGAVSISWSGATAGDNNPISGYRVYYKAGSAPTISTTTYKDVSSSPYSFTIPSGATRGTTYYFKVVTKSSVGSDWDSNISSVQATVVVNQLPGTPTVSVDKTRIKSTGGTVTFTISPGTDSNTGQTLEVWYNTDNTSWSGSNCKQVPSNGKLTTPTLTATTTYYFKTWDGLEYSSSYTSKTIKVNTPPTIGSVTMSAYNNTTYSPSTTVSGVERLYVKNINGSASNVTKDSEAKLTYQWKLQVGSGASATSYGTTTNISTATSLSNIDVTSYGANFNTAYRLALTVTDDVGDSATAYSSTVFAIPAVPTVSKIINWKGEEKHTNTNQFHFNNNLRIYYNKDNNGLTRTLEYYTDYKDWPTKPSSVSLSYSNSNSTYYSDATVSSLNRGTTYYFRIKYSFGNATAYSVISSSFYHDSSRTNITRGYTRANDIKPNISDILAVKPYTNDMMTVIFSNQPISWEDTQDVATSYGNIYTTTLWYEGRSQAIGYINTSPNAPSNSDGTVTVKLNLGAITTAQWITLINGSNSTSAPNKSYSITLEIIATNGFGATFSNTKTFTANFAEGFISGHGSLALGIKTGDSAFTIIPTSTYTSSNRYSLFPTQTIRFTISGLQCYANQSFTVTVRDTEDSSGTILGTISGTANDWELLSGSTRIYSLKTSGNKSIDYLISSISTSVDKTFYVLITLNNGYTKELTSSICKYRRIQISSIKPKISEVTESESSANYFNFTYQITDYGGDTVVETGFSTASKQGGYSSITGRFIKCATANGTYSNVGSSNIDLKGKNAGTLVQLNINDTLSPINSDILYFGIKINLTVAFVKIGNATPTGTSSYPLTFKGLYTLHRETPNLLYGKNFFVMNGTAPRNDGHLLLEIKSAGYRSESTDVTRNMIYIGDGDTAGTLEINSTDGLVIDCGSW